jgi:hypothetical protein
MNPQLTHALIQARHEELRRAAKRSFAVALCQPSRSSLIVRLRETLSRARRPARPTITGALGHAGR